MSSSTFPPTPAPSADISGKSDTRPARLEGAFSLPPAAMANSRSGSSSASTVSSGSSESSYRPISPSSPVARSKPTLPSSDKRSKHSHPAVSSEEFSLPPPPTRSRKIIQMKPRTQDAQPARKDQKDQSTAQAATSKTTTSPTSVAGTKRKQPNGSTAAGRKVARKTAHSLIERRRRSKMNEEFSVLKNMIPACAGQEMHKLAILQASIEYMRYLEQCVSDLQAAVTKSRIPSSPSKRRRTSQAPPSAPPNPPDADPDDEDHDMSDAPSPSASPSTTTSHPNPIPSSLISSTSTRTSPALPASNASSALPSPAFSAPQSQHPSTTLPSFATFALTSPALVPQRDREDHEATAALLMLGEDRRWDGNKEGKRDGRGGAGAGGERRGRGMSVRDLLRE